MKKMIVGCMAATLLVAAPTMPASAGIFADDATRCLAKSTTETDQLALVKWIYASIAQHPALRETSNITAAQRTDIDKEMRAIVMRLLLQNCHAETVAAIKNEGPGFLEKSFEAVGQFAMASLMSNPDVSKGLEAWVTPDVVQGFTTLFTEAGRPPAPKP